MKAKSPPARTTPPELQPLLGQPLHAVLTFADGRSVRVGWKDGFYSVVTRDHKTDRINVALKNDQVIAAWFG